MAITLFQYGLCLVWRLRFLFPLMGSSEANDNWQARERLRERDKRETRQELARVETRNRFQQGWRALRITLTPSIASTASTALSGQNCYYVLTIKWVVIAVNAYTPPPSGPAA